MSDPALRRRLSESSSPACPSCGREAIVTVTGQCIHCLQVVGGSSRIEAGSILRLHDLDRSRARVRGADDRRRLRKLIALLTGVGVALVLVLLFDQAMRWASQFFARGLVTG